MRLDNSKREALLSKTVNVMLELRSAYLAAGGSPLKHWSQLHDRLRMAARTSSGVPEWITKMTRSLQIGVPSSSLSSAVDALCHEVECIPQPAWLDLIEREHAYVMALTRLEAEDRKAQRVKTVKFDQETGEVIG